MSGATLSRERYLLECARQERLEREAEASRMAFAEALAAARREERDRIREILLSISAEYDEAGRLRESEALDNAIDRALPLTPEEP